LCEVDFETMLILFFFFFANLGYSDVDDFTGKETHLDVWMRLSALGNARMSESLLCGTNLGT